VIVTPSDRSRERSRGAYPELVTYGSDGQVEIMRYSMLSAIHLD